MRWKVDVGLSLNIIAHKSSSIGIRYYFYCNSWLLRRPFRLRLIIHSSFIHHHCLPPPQPARCVIPPCMHFAQLEEKHRWNLLLFLASCSFIGHCESAEKRSGRRQRRHYNYDNTVSLYLQIGPTGTVQRSLMGAASSHNQQTRSW